MATRCPDGFRITRKTKIVLEFLIELILHGTASSKASKKINVHRNYIGRLLPPLKKAGYITTNTGGGCHFIGNPDEITVLKIVELTEGSISIRALFNQDNLSTKSQRHFPKIWLDMEHEIREKLASVTVQNLVDAYATDAIDTMRPDGGIPIR